MIKMIMLMSIILVGTLYAKKEISGFFRLFSERDYVSLEKLNKIYSKKNHM